MSVVRCPTASELEQLFLGGLPEEEAQTWEEHILLCASCLERLQALGHSADPLANLLHEAHRCEPPVCGPVEADLMQRLKAQRPVNPPAAPSPSPAEAPTAFFGTDAPTPGGEMGFLQPAGRPDSLGRLGHYEVLEILGRGGFGIVFRAFDERLQRVVAIKVLAPELAATSPARKRFLREARAAAQIRHENVVQIYAVEEQPLPYLVVEYVPGETLQQRLDRIGPFEAAEVAAIGRQMANGLAAAHAAGLIHRDVKPGNVLIEEGPRLRIKITDFGLARAADDASLTQSGVVAGTPLFMSPEQAAGAKLDHRSDLFSLGSVLYAITSGRPPFRAENTLAILKRVAEDTPRPIPEIIPETPEWVCQIIAKLMAKDPDQRFQTAAVAAEALEAGLTLPKTAPLPVRPAPHRPPVRKLLVGGVLALVGVLALTVFWLTRPGADAERNGLGPERDNKQPGKEVRQLPTIPVPTPEELAAHPSPADALKRPAGPPAGMPPEVVAVLGTGRGFVFPRNDDGRQYPRMNKDGTLLAAPAGRGGNVELFEVSSGQRLRTLPWPGRQVLNVAFSPDGSALAAVSGAPSALRIWDLKTGEVRHNAPANAPPDNFMGVVYSPDGRWLVVAVTRPEPLARVCDARTLQEIKSIPGTPYSQFSPDSKLLAAYRQDIPEVGVWNTETWEPVKTLPTTPGIFGSVSFSPDGKLLAAGSAKGLRLWRTDTFEPAGAFNLACFAFGFLADGKTVLAQGEGYRFVRWDVTTGKQVGEFQIEGPEGDIAKASVSPDGRNLLVSLHGRFPRVRVFDPETGQERLAPTKHDGPVLAVAISPDGTTAASAGAGADTRIRLWDLATGRLLHVLPARPQPQCTLAFSPDGKTLASGSVRDGAITFWDWQAGRDTGSLTLGLTVAQLAHSPDGKLLAFRLETGETKLYDVATKKLRVLDPGGFDGGGCVAFSPDGKTLATGGSDKLLRLYDVETGKEQATLGGAEDVIRWVAFRPDGRSVAFCGGAKDRLIRHWDLEPRAEKPALRGHTSGVLGCVWRADGQLLASAGVQDGMVRLWGPDARPPQSRALRLFAPVQGRICCLALTPEGRHLVTGHADGTLWVLRLAGLGEVLAVP